MGQYFSPVNTRTREYLHAHRLGDGLKWGEWVAWPESNTNRATRALIDSGRWNPADVIIQGDNGTAVAWGDLGREVADVGCDFDCRDEFRDISREAAILVGVEYEPDGCEDDDDAARERR